MIPNYRPLFDAIVNRETERKALQQQRQTLLEQAAALDAQMRAHYQQTQDANDTALALEPVDTRDGKVVPVVIARSDNQLVLALKDDELGDDVIVSFDRDGTGRVSEHLFGAPKEDGQRDCLTPGHAHRAFWPTVKPSVDDSRRIEDVSERPR